MGWMSCVWYFEQAGDSWVRVTGTPLDENSPGAGIV